MTVFEYRPPPKIPARFRYAGIDKKTHPILAGIANKFLDNFEAYYQKGIAPAFFGSPGIGKTYVCGAIARRLYYDMNVPVLWSGVVRTLNRLMDYKDLRDSAAYRELKRNILTYPVVVLDDFGHMQEFSRTKELFFEIVDTRYANKRCTLFTANFEVGDSKDSWQVLSQTLNPAITRRIRLMSKGLLFTGGMK